MTPGDSLMARLGLDTSGFKAGLKDAHSAFSKLAGQIGVGLSVAGIASYTRGIAEYGARVSDLGKRYQVSTDVIQKFGNAAEQNGSSLDGMAKGFNKLDIATSKALGGNEKITKAFAHLGITVADLRTMTPEELMLKLGHSSMNAADMVAVLGKSALELIPTLKGLANGTIDMGDAIDKNLIEQLKRADKELTRFGQSLKIYTASHTLQGLYDMGRAFKDIGLDIGGATGRMWELTRALFSFDSVRIKKAAGSFNDELPGHADWRQEALQRNFANYDFENMPGSPQWLAKHNIKAAPPDKISKAELAAEKKDRERDQLSLKELAGANQGHAATEQGWHGWIGGTMAPGTAQMQYASQQARLVQQLEEQARQVRLTGISATGETSAGLLGRADAIRQTLPIKETEKEVGIYRDAFKESLSDTNEKLDELIANTE